MKKIMPILMVFALMLSILPYSTVNAASITNDVDSTSITNEKIENILIGYFSNSLEVQSKLKEIDNKYVVPNSDLDKYVKLHSKVTVQWYEGTGEQTEWYKVNININSISKEKELIKVDVDNKVSLKYGNTSFDSSYVENHIVYLSNNGNKLLVQRDIFDIERKAKEVEDEFNSYGDSDGYKKYINNKISYLESKLLNVNNDVQKFKNEVKSQSNSVEANAFNIMATATYDGNAAATWALNNVYSPEDYDGADCTNFVSKAINAGGIPTDSTWYQGSNAWIRVIELKNYLINKGRATEYSSYEYARIGDIIQYHNGSVWRHSVIVTGKDNWNTYPYVSAHSNPQYNISASYYYPNGYFSNYRVLDVYYQEQLKVQ